MKHRNNLFVDVPLAAIVVLLLLFCTITAAPAQNTLSAQDIAKKALAATVYLEMQDKSGKTLGFGSGFFVKPNIIATNYHVIEGAAKGTAKLVGKSTRYNIEGVTATDQVNDLALIKVTAYGVKPLFPGNSDTVEIGDTVYVAGNPKGLEGTFSDGIISSRRDKYTKERLQMTAPISPRSSGGPVLNRKGEVIGVSVAVHRDLYAQNLNFAIPSNYLRKLLDQSKSPAPPPPNISAKTYISWGLRKMEVDDYEGAIADFTEAIGLRPDLVLVYGMRGNAKSHLGQHFAAIQDYDTAIQLKSNHPEAYIDRGVVKAKLEQYEAAIVDFDAAIRLKPDLATAYLNRGISKALLGRTWEAKQDLQTALRLAEKSDDVRLKSEIEKALQIIR